MATTNINTPTLPIDRVPPKFDETEDVHRPDVPDMPVFSGGRQTKVEHSSIAGSQSGTQSLNCDPELGENDPEVHGIPSKEYLDSFCDDLSKTDLSKAAHFQEFVTYKPRDVASAIGKGMACVDLMRLYKGNLSLEEKLMKAGERLNEWSKRYLFRAEPSLPQSQTSDSSNPSSTKSEAASSIVSDSNADEKLDKVNDQLNRISDKLNNAIEPSKVSVLTPKNLRDLGLEDDRVRQDGGSSQSERSRTTGDDSFWTFVGNSSSKSSSSSKSRESGSRSTGSNPDVQSRTWSDSCKAEVNQIFSLLPPQTEEQKTLASKVLRRMKFGPADRLLKSYLSLYSRDSKYPVLSDANAELLLLLVEDLLPGYQKTCHAFQVLYEGCLPEPELPSPPPPTENKVFHSKGGNSGRKFKQYRLDQAAENPISLPGVSGDNKNLEAKDPPASTGTEEPPPLEEASTTASTNVELEPKPSFGIPRSPLPRYMKFRQGDKVVIATLHANDEDPISDHAIKAQEATYLLEPYTYYKRKLIPWHDLDPDFPSRPFEINAAQLVDLAGRRWAGREDLEQKRSLLAHGYENCYHTNYVDKINLMRDNFIRVLDVVLGDKTRGKAYEPETIPCVNSTFSMPNPPPHAKIWVKPGFERRKRAYSLLNLFVDHYVFPLTSDELKKGIIKRTSCCQNESSWRKCFRDIVHVCQSLMFDKESIDDVKPGDFLSFAREMISRKGLSEGESMPLFAAAKYAEFLLEMDGSNQRLLSMLSYCLERETKVFVKDEEYEKTDTTVRFIVSPHAFVKIVFGTVFRPVEEKLYFDERSPLKKHLIKGKTQEEVKEMLTSMPKKPGEVYCEVDAKAFESSQNERTLKWEYRIYKSFYSQNSLAYAIIDRVREANCRPGWLYNKFFRILRNAMRLSGLNTTACGNALWNYINLVAVCGVDPDSVFYLEGDDGILVLAVSIALAMTERSLFPLTFLMADQWSQLSFCGHHYDADGQRIISRESLVRKLCTYFSANPINRRKAYELLYLRLLSFQLSYPGNPYLDELIEEVNLEYADVRSAGVRQKTVRQWYKENWWRFDNHVGELKLPADTSFVPSFHKLYDRLLQKIDQAGELILPRTRVEVANYCLAESYHGKVSNVGNFLLSVCAAGYKFVRRLSGVHNRSPENSLKGRPMPSAVAPDTKEERRARFHDIQIDYLNQFSWFRKLARKTGWSVLKYSDRAAVGPCDEYFPDTDSELVLCTRAFNHEWHKLMRLDELASNGPLGPGRAKGVRAL